MLPRKTSHASFDEKWARYANYVASRHADDAAAIFVFLATPENAHMSIDAIRRAEYTGRDASVKISAINSYWSYNTHGDAQEIGHSDDTSGAAA